MNKENSSQNRFWSLIVGLATIVSCVAGLFVVPEIRSLLGLPTDSTKDNFQQVYLVDYSDLYQIEKYNLGLENGQQKLLGIPFEIGWKITTQCSHTPENPTEINIGVNVHQPVDVYLLIQAGYGLTLYEGNTIGGIELRFNEDKNYYTPLILGENIRDWAISSDAVFEVTSPNTRTAHKGIDPGSGKLGRIDMMAIFVPNELTSSTLEKIIISDLSEINPCIHLLAITIKVKP
jgi:hypothetical protein